MRFPNGESKIRGSVDHKTLPPDCQIQRKVADWVIHHKHSVKCESWGETNRVEKAKAVHHETTYR